MKRVFSYLCMLCIVLFCITGCKKSRTKPTEENEEPPENSIALATGSYKLITAGTYTTTKMAVGVKDSSSQNEAALEQRTFNTNNGQEWRIVDLGGGEYHIININSGLALDIAGTLAVKGAALQQMPLSTGNSQRWKIAHQGKEAYRIISKLNADLGICITDGGVVIDTFNKDNYNSYFIITPATYKDRVATNWFGTRTSGFTAGDGGYTVPLNDGRVLWTFGDSYIDNYRESDATIPCVFNVNNQGLLQPANNWDWTKTTAVVAQGSGTGRTIWKTPRSIADKSYYWPVAGIQLVDTAYVFCNGVKTTGGFFGPTGIEAVFKMKTTAAGVELAGFKEFPKNYFNSINFGVGFVKDEAAGYVYIYGQLKPSGVFVFTTNVYVARFPINDPGSPWQFYKGGLNTNDASWVADSKQAAIIGSGAGYNVSVGKVKGKYIIASNAANFCNDGRDIYTATSGSPTGPFTDRTSVYQIDERHQGMSPLFYSTVIHPEHINNDNEILITYSVNGYGSCLNTCNGSFRMPRSFYILKGIRVPLKLIDASL